MLGLLARNWCLFAIRGIAAIAFGVLAFIGPLPTAFILALLFGLFVAVRPGAAGRHARAGTAA